MGMGKGAGMTGRRSNILTSSSARNDYLRGCVLLDQEDSGVTAQDVFNFLRSNIPSLPMRGIQQDLSTYDLFVLWHVATMSIQLSVGNAAHGGPIFLPWHRMYLIRLEQQLQRVLADPNFALPYWDWAADGEIQPPNQQWQTILWSSTHLGDARNEVNSGQLGAMRVRLWQSGGVLWSIDPRPIERDAGRDVPDLPNEDDVIQAHQESQYDQPSWGMGSVSHRNRLEGWLNGPQLHNRVHVWVGGDMSPGTSPNDPVFFLNHCNVDRIWEAWMANHGRVYRPSPTEGPAGHRLNDQMVAILGESMRPEDVLDPTEWYDYDSLK
ncbi:MAG: tyrosinase family protein [Planctomycetota bacterium]